MEIGEQLPVLSALVTHTPPRTPQREFRSRAKMLISLLGGSPRLFRSKFRLPNSALPNSPNFPCYSTTQIS